jgi:hypothetical protein
MYILYGTHPSSGYGEGIMTGIMTKHTNAEFYTYTYIYAALYIIYIYIYIYIYYITIPVYMVLEVKTT